MQPSSLIFLVVIAVWAAFFLQHWVRRREHVATARSMDRFSEAMRVLDHAALVAAADETEHSSHGASPLVAGPAKVASASQHTVVVGARAHVGVGPGGPAGLREAGLREAGLREAGLREAELRAPGPGRVRGTLLLLAFLATVVVAGLAGFDLLARWAPAVPVCATVGSFLWVRQGVRSAQAARRQSARAARHRPPHAQGRPEAAPSHAPRSAPATGAARRYSAPEAPSEVPAERPAGRRANDEPYDLSLVDPPPPDVVRSTVVASATVETATLTGSSVTAVAGSTAGVWREPVPATSPRGPATLAELMVDDDDIPLTWDPVPVPRPTYTMKARVDRRMPEPADTVAEPGGAAPAEADGADTAYRQGGDRRVAGA